MKTIITVVVMAIAFVTFVQAKGLSPAVEQVCAAEASRIKNLKMSAVRTGREVLWVDGTVAIILQLPDNKQGVCWVNGKGEVEQMTFNIGVTPGQEQVCAAEAAAIRKVRMSALRTDWAAEGPKGSAWVILTLEGETIDCHVNASNEVLEVASNR